MPHAPAVLLGRRALAGAVVAGAMLIEPSLAVTDEPVHIAWKLSPAVRYSADVHMTHVIANDLGGVLKKLAGSKADPVTIVEDRTVEVDAGPSGAIDAAVVDVRHYGGDHPKDSSVVRRTAQYKGTLSDDGKRDPTGEPLVDPGDGALAQVPDGPVAPGQAWTFSRNVLVDRELGQGAMTYTDTLTRIDTRAGHRVAVIDVKGTGRVDVASDLKAKGFRTTDIALTGTAEFDLTTGLPGLQHYVAHAQWNTKVLWVHIGLIFDDVYDAAPWNPKGH